MGDQHHRHGSNQADGREILARVVTGVGIETWIDRHRAGVTEQERVAVGLGLGDRPGAERAAGAAAVVDHDVLLERDRKLFRNDASDRIDAAARRERHDKRDGPRRPALRRCGRRQRRERGRARSQLQKVPAWKH
jgi:hypothetical protein